MLWLVFGDVLNMGCEFDCERFFSIKNFFENVLIDEGVLIILDDLFVWVVE